MAEPLLNFENVRKVLEDYADWVAKHYKANLLDSDRNASGKLSSSIRAYVEAGDRWFEVRMDLEKYWEYVEYNTRPHFPPVEAIQKWIDIKPVIPRPDSQGRIPTTKQLAFLIARKILQVGTRGIPDLGDVEDRADEYFRPRLEEALQADVGAYITRVFRDNNNTSSQ